MASDFDESSVRTDRRWNNVKLVKIVDFKPSSFYMNGNTKVLLTIAYTIESRLRELIVTHTDGTTAFFR